MTTFGINVMPKGEQIHRLINIRVSRIIYFDGSHKYGKDTYRNAYEASKGARYDLNNLIGRMAQGEVGDGNYGRGQG